MTVRGFKADTEYVNKGSPSRDSLLLSMNCQTSRQRDRRAVVALILGRD